MAKVTIRIERQTFSFTYKKTVDDDRLSKMTNYDIKNIDALVNGGTLDSVIKDAIYYDINTHNIVLRSITISPHIGIDILAMHPSYRPDKNLDVIKSIDSKQGAGSDDIMFAKRRFYLAVKKTGFMLKSRNGSEDPALKKLTADYIADNGRGEFVFNVSNNLINVSKTFELPDEKSKDKAVNFIIDMPTSVRENMQAFNDSKRFGLIINDELMSAEKKKGFLIFPQYAMPDIHVGMTFIVGDTDTQ